MAYLQRLSFAALVLLSSWVPSASYASFPATALTNYNAVAFQSAAFIGAYGSYQAACDATRVNGQAYYPSNPYDAIVTGSSCQVTFWTSAAKTSFSARKTYTIGTAAAGYSCSVGAALSGSTCTCTAPTSAQVGTGETATCENPDAAKCTAHTGGADLFTGFSSFPSIGSAFCPSDGAASSCGATVTGGFAIVKNGVKVWTYEVSYTGSTCIPPVAGTTGTETTCKGTMGTVNGVSVCSPPSDQNTVDSIKSTTATNPVNPASAPGSGGSTTTGTSTTCQGAKCTTTTTTTTTPAGGGAPVTTVETKDEPKDDFCKNNPRAVMCITSSFGGSCGSAFTCDGDAVQCATAREIHTRNCRMFDQESPESLLYGTEKNKAGSQVANENVAISSANFDTSDAIGGSGACITDKVVTVMGSPITIPFSGVCVHLAMLGNVLLTVSFLLAGRIFMRG